MGCASSKMKNALAQCSRPALQPRISQVSLKYAEGAGADPGPADAGLSESAPARAARGRPAPRGGEEGP